MEQSILFTLYRNITLFHALGLSMQIKHTTNESQLL